MHHKANLIVDQSVNLQEKKIFIMEIRFLFYIIFNVSLCIKRHIMCLIHCDTDNYIVEKFSSRLTRLISLYFIFSLLLQQKEILL